MVILASASPRRRELLALILAEFDVIPSDIEERLAGSPSPETVADLALRKARAVAGRVDNGVALAADTVVVVDGEALGKPGSAIQAWAMLRRLRGRAHEVITGVAGVDARTGRARLGGVVSRVVMRRYTDEAIEEYVAGGEPFDKAGGYAIQEQGGRLVAGWAGSYSNIVGLPLEATGRLLGELGVRVSFRGTGGRA